MSALHITAEGNPMSERTRLDPKERKAQLLEVALKLAEKHGYKTLTKDQIAKAGGCSPGLVHARLGDMAALPNALMRAAVKQENVTIVAQGLVDKHRAAMRAPEALKKKAVAHILGQR